MSSLSFFPLIPAVTTASAAPVYHGGMIPCLGDVEPVNTRWLIKGYFPMGAVSVVAGIRGKKLKELIVISFIFIYDFDVFLFFTLHRAPPKKWQQKRRTNW